jgi:hypothetical protein
MWWAHLATTRPDSGADLQIVAARLDPDARFSFRIDLPAGVDPASVLGQLSALADDAAFPGYPYPLSVADRLAACPGWLRDDVRSRAFADRHRLMERS